MTGVGLARRRDAGEYEQQREWETTDVRGREPRVALKETSYAVYQQQHTFNDYIAESWLPQTAPTWSRSLAASNENGTGHDHQWSHEPLEFSKQFDAPRQDHGLVLNTAFDYMLPEPERSPTVSTEYEFATSCSDSHTYQPSEVNHLPQEYGINYHSQTPQSSYHQPAPSIYETSFQVQPNTYPNIHKYVFMQDQHIPQWSPSTADTFLQESNASISNKSGSPTLPSRGLTLDWSICDQSSSNSMKGNNHFFTLPVPKRKASYEAPSTTTTNKWVDLSKKDITECVDVFENAPGALAGIKRRRKLDAPVRKAAREVRKAGACHQCRFRKRTVS